MCVAESVILCMIFKIVSINLSVEKYQKSVPTLSFPTTLGWVFFFCRACDTLLLKESSVPKSFVILIEKFVTKVLLNLLFNFSFEQGLLKGVNIGGKDKALQMYLKMCMMVKFGVTFKR